MTIVTVGGGWAGCAAALGAAKAGVRSVLLERTDQLLGTGLVGGIMRNNGRFAAAEELIAMGAAHCFHLQMKMRATRIFPFRARTCVPVRCDPYAGSGTAPFGGSGSRNLFLRACHGCANGWHANYICQYTGWPDIEWRPVHRCNRNSRPDGQLH